ncbi:MAG: NADH-quinone oxidoreductase subunit J [Polyangiaceae bacterium]|nr:NADH-quinone oxidoreductase subunit J [Polyangiaceae bacterium]
MNVELLKTIYFYLFAACALAGAVSTIAARNPIRGAMGLLLTIGSMAGLFLSLHAEFLAAVQLIVYAGAVVVLFLFAIMVLGPEAVPSADNETVGPRVFAGACVALASISAVWMSWEWTGDRTREGARVFTALPTADPATGTVESVAREVFGVGIVPFEIASALLIVSIVGAVAVARGKQGEPAHRRLPAVPSLPDGLVKKGAAE